MDGTSSAKDGTSRAAPYLAAACLGCLLALFVEPVATGGAMGVSGGLERALVGVAVAGVGGLSMLRLVMDARARAREARRQAEALRRSDEAIATVARELTSGRDARARICRAAGEVTGATLISLREPDGRGRLIPSAALGDDLPPIPIDLAEEASGTALAFATRRRVVVPDAERERIVSPRLLAATGSRSLLFEPVLRGEEPIGVLVIGWPEPTGDLSERPLSAIRLLAAEAAIAIERERLLAELEAAARTDPLTGLANRRVWDDELPRELARAGRYRQPVTIALLDLDRFKDFNDEHGHQAGDTLLRNAAAAWSEQTRDVDLLARFGGDEFAVLLPNCGPDSALQALERVRAATPGRQTCSAGVAQWNGVEDADALLARADRALYEAKREGRDRTTPATVRG